MSSNFQYTRVNFMKFIGAFLVIVIHTHPFFNISWGLNFFFVNVLARIAVPFYLVTSGFFLYSKVAHLNEKRNKEKIMRYLLKLLKLYVLWSGVYLIINLPAYFSNKSLLTGIIHVIRNFLFTSIDVHLWYLLATAVGVYIAVIVLKKLGWTGLVSISLICSLLLLVTQTYSGLISETIIGTGISLYERIFGTIANSFIMAVPFLTLGMVICRYEWMNQLKHSRCWCIVAFMAMIVEHFGTRLLGISTDYAVSLSLILFTVVFFIYLLQKDQQSQPDFLLKYSLLFQQGSLFIYLIHIAFLRLLLVIYGQLGIENPRLITFILISLASVGSYLCLQRITVVYQWLMNPIGGLKRKQGV